MNRARTTFRRFVCGLVTLSLAASSLAAGYVFRVPLQPMAAAAPGSLQLTPGSYAFGTVMQGSSSATSFTLRNPGGTPIAVNSIAADGNFSQSNSCPNPLGPGASCSIGVVFTPTAATTYSGTLSVVGDGASASASLSGTSVEPSRRLTLTPSSLNFGEVDVGSSSSARTVIIKNDGNLNAAIAGLGLSSGASDFTQSNTCGAVLAPGASCTVTLRFTPASAGLLSGNLAVVEQTQGTPYSVALQGFAGQTLLNVTPDPIDAGSAVVGQAPGTAEVSLSNAGNRDIQGLTVVTSGSSEFGVPLSSCASTLAAGQTCSVTVSFTPTSAGARSASLNISSTSGVARSPTVTGTGVVASSDVASNPSSLDLGSVVVGQSAASKTATLTNVGNAPASITNVRLASSTAGFTLGHDCPAQLAAGSTCTVTVGFTPASQGVKSTSVLATVNGAATAIGLTGRALQGAVSLTPSSISFPTQQVGATSALTRVTLKNSGDAALQVSGVSVATGGSDFGASNSCGSTLPPNGTCDIDVEFTPTTAGARAGAVAITHDGVGGVSYITLSGAGQAPSATLSAASHGAVASGSVKNVTAVLTNTGIAALSLTTPSAASVTGAGFSFQSTTCSASLAAGASCDIVVQFAPSGTATYAGTLSVSTQAGSKTVALSGQSEQSVVSVSSNSASALTAVKGAAAATGTVVYTNTGNIPATLSIGGLSAPYSVSTNSCTVAVGGTCTVTVTMATSGAIGAQGAQTLSATGAGNGTVTAIVAGALTGSDIAVSGNTANAIVAVKGGAAGSGTVTYTNNGNSAATLTFSGLSSPYSLSPASCSIAANGGTCEVTVSMATTGAIGAQASQTLTASGGTTGSITAPVAGTVNGSDIAVTANTANAIVATKGGADGTGSVTFKNNGNQPVTIALSGLAAPYSVSPSSCTLAAAASCTVTVSMATTGTIGAQAADSLTATGGTTGVVSAPVGGTLNGSQLSVTANTADTIVATKGGTAGAGTVTFKNIGNQSATVTLGGLAAPYSVSPTSCTLAAAASCTVTVSMATTGTIGAQAADSLTATGGTTGVVSAPVGGTLNGSQLSVTANTADTIVATKGGTAGTGTVTFKNVGNQSATVTLGGLAAPYSVSPTSCTLAAAASCTVTVSMATTGTIGAQAADSLTATGGTTGVVSAPVGGTLNGSQLSVTANTADTIVATKGGTAGTGTVTFKNIGNQSATVTLSGLAAPYSVSPTSCTLAAAASCTVTVSMATTGAIGAQTADSLTATGANAGAVSAPVGGTLNGSQISVTANTADTIVATKGGTAGTGTVTYKNVGNQSATITLSGLAAPYSFSPASCTLAAAASCTVTVSMATTGAIGAQAADSLTATGGTTGAVGATVQGTLNGSSIAVTANTADTISAVKGGAVGKGTVTYKNNGNVSGTISLSGLSSPYSVSPTSCTLAAGASCSVTVSMSTGGAVGQQAADTLVAAGGTTGAVNAAVRGTLTGTQYTASQFSCTWASNAGGFYSRVINNTGSTLTLSDGTTWSNGAYQQAVAPPGYTIKVSVDLNNGQTVSCQSTTSSTATVN